MAVPVLGIFTAGQILTSDDMNETGSAVNGLGLFIVKTQTIGTAVSSVTVTGAFSADYESYRIIVSGGTASSNAVSRMTLGASAAGYYSSIQYASYAGVAGTVAGNGIAYWNLGYGSLEGLSVCIDIHKPFIAEETWFGGSFVGVSAGSVQGAVGGYHNLGLSYSAFTITAGAGTFTGGTIRVYGYRNSYS